MFKVIYGNKDNIYEIRKKKAELYKENYYANLYGFNDNASLEKAIFYGVRYIARFNMKNLIKDKQNKVLKEFVEEKFNKKIPDSKIETYTKFLNVYDIQKLNEILEEIKTKELLKYKLDIMDIKNLISKISYREFITIFPIIKEYNGAKFECKDYFCVMDYLSNINLDDKINLDDMNEFFWAYYNNDIMMFVVNEMSCVDSLLIMNGKKSLMDSFLEEIDPDNTIHTYTYNEKHNYMQDNVTGETFSVKKFNPAIKKFKIIRQGE